MPVAKDPYSCFPESAHEGTESGMDAAKHLGVIWFWLRGTEGFEGTLSIKSFAAYKQVGMFGLD